MYSYNARGKVITVTNPYSKVTTMTYAANNVDLISIKDDLGEENRTYNSTHDVTSLKDRLGNTTTYAYNAYGQVTSAQDALGIVTNYSYDAGHRLAAITRDGQTLHQYTYDALDRVRTHTDPTGLTLTYDYNDLDQVTRITYPDSKFKTYQYSTCCPFKVDSITERSGQTTFYSYDQLNRLTSVTDPAGGVTGFTYDLNGNRTALVDPKGNTTSFNYDFNNRPIKKTYMDGTYESFTYDSNYPVNHILSRRNAQGIITNYRYIYFDKLSSFWDNNGPTTYHYYDYYGRRTSSYSTEIGNFFYYTYDANSRLVSVDSPWANDKITYQYDVLGRRTGLTWENGKGQPVTYTYDNLNRLTGVNVGGQVYTYGYTGASPLVRSLTRPDGAATTYEYDLLNRLAQTTTRVGETVVNRYVYTYNDQDLRAGEAATEPGAPAPYASELVTYEYNNVNALTRMADPGAKPLAYDAAGNLVNGYTPEGYVFTGVYDGSSRLTSLSYADGAGAVHKSDFHYLGNTLIRRKDYINGALTIEKRYLYDGGLMVQERDGANNVVNEYAWGLGLPGGIGGLLDLHQGGAHYSYLYDGKGNVTALLDGNANIAATYAYGPFGEPRVTANSLQQPFQFSTKQYDEKTGLSYYGYRYYIPSLGRWLTRDPLGEAGGINLYGFVGNNPVDFIDPMGLEVVPVITRQGGTGIGIPVYYDTDAGRYYPPGHTCDPYKEPRPRWDELDWFMRTTLEAISVIKPGGFYLDPRNIGK